MSTANVPPQQLFWYKNMDQISSKEILGSPYSMKQAHEFNASFNQEKRARCGGGRRLD